MITEYPGLFNVTCKAAEATVGGLSKWDKRSQKMLLVHLSRRKECTFLTILLIHLTIIIVYAVQGIPTLHTEHVNARTKLTDWLIYTVGVIANICTHLTIWVCYLHRKEICAYINGLINFHTTYLSEASEGSETILTKINLTYVVGMIGISYMGPVAYSFGLHWKDPCKLSLSGYWILPECHRFELDAKVGGIQQITYWGLATFLKFGVIWGNNWMWAMGTKAANMTVGAINLMCTTSLASSVEKFLEEAGKNMEDMFGLALMYRKIQILALLMNKIQSGWQMTMIIYGSTICQAICMATIVKVLALGDWDIPSLVFFGMLLTDAIGCQLVIIGGMGRIYGISEQVIQNLTTKLGPAQYKTGSRVRNAAWRRRFYRSCRVIKVSFGDDNFVDSLTPLNCVGQGNEQAINLLLLDQ